MKKLKPTEECTVCKRQVCRECSVVCGFCFDKIICVDCLKNQKGKRAISHPRCKDDEDETDY